MSREFCSNSPKIIAQIGAPKPLAGSNLQNSLLISLLAGKWDAIFSAPPKLLFVKVAAVNQILRSRPNWNGLNLAAPGRECFVPRTTRACRRAEERHDEPYGQRQSLQRRRGGRHALAVGVARHDRADRDQIWLRYRTMRRLHRAHRRR